jgi:hypothetical protein
MVHMMARVEVTDFDVWLRVHRANAEHRRAFGIIDGPIYQDLDQPNAVLVHTCTDDPSRAAQWFQTKPSSRQPVPRERCVVPSIPQPSRTDPDQAPLPRHSAPHSPTLICLGRWLTIRTGRSGAGTRRPDGGCGGCAGCHARPPR